MHMSADVFVACYKGKRVRIQGNMPAEHLIGMTGVVIGSEPGIDPYADIRVSIILDPGQLLMHDTEDNRHRSWPPECFEVIDDRPKRITPLPLPG